MRADLHVHSIYSYDGRMSIKEIAKVARRRKIDAVAITDHDRITLKRRAVEYGVILIPGVERSYGKMHVLMIGECVAEMKRKPELEELSDYECLVVLAHPERSRVPEEIARRFMVSEVNGRSSMENVLKVISKRELLSAGSDAHSRFQLGRTYLFDEGIVYDGTFRRIDIAMSSFSKALRKGGIRRAIINALGIIKTRKERLVIRNKNSEKILSRLELIRPEG